ncbi:MAG TPA: RDD family protein [Gaiellaceae bacterium]|nr:RDD family protein [Gaiellaceae bacterium]
MATRPDNLTSKTRDPKLPVVLPQSGDGRPEDVAIGLVVIGARFGWRAGRLALAPLRAAGRITGTTGRVQRVTGGVGAEGRTATSRGRAGVEAVVDRALASPLPEELAQIVIGRHVIERVVADVLPRLSLDETLTAALEDERTQQQFVRALESPAVKQMAMTAAESRLAAEVADRLLASPEVRAALARQTVGFGGELVHRLRNVARRIDDRSSRGSADEGHRRHGGIATRMIALATDAALVHLLVLVPAIFIALIASLFGGLHSGWLVDSVLGIAWFVIVAVYFVGFWSVLGQTPGLRLTGSRVVDHTGSPPSVGRSIVRLIGLALAVIPFFAGFLPVFFDNRRRALQDYLAGTDVVAHQT